jgi:hypothetical protein
MRLPRLILTGLLSLGICLQGFAAVRADASCPMVHEESSMEDMSSEHTAAMTAHTDCLTDMQTHDPENSGTHCPAGMNCLSTVAALPSVLRAPASQRMVLPGFPDPAYHFQSHSSLLLWRPPALI